MLHRKLNDSACAPTVQSSGEGVAPAEKSLTKRGVP
jgi:hypothetical protein